MKVVKLPTFCRTVTVLNKRAGRDSSDHLDAWKKTVLHNCAWSGKRTQAERFSGGQEIEPGASFTVRVPQSDDYKPYSAWKHSMDGFTFSTGDYIILGEVFEEVSPDTVLSVVAQYKPDAFCIQAFRDNTTGPMPHYRLEGV